MGQWADDEVWRFMNRRGPKQVVRVHKCPTCKRTVHFMEDGGDTTVLADNHNGKLTRHVCSMKARFNVYKNSKSSN